MTIAEKIDKIIMTLKSGECYSLGCAAYEEYYWYKDGEFHSSMENGIHDPVDTVRSEEAVRRSFTTALLSPNQYDVWLGI